MTRQTKSFRGYAPITLGVVASFFGAMGLLAMVFDRDDIYVIAFIAGILMGVVAIIWNQSRYSKMVIKVRNKRKKHLRTTERDDQYGNKRTVDEYEYWVTCDRGTALVGGKLYHFLEKGGVYEVMAQTYDDELYIATFPRSPKRIR